jgi:CRP-like cAMP-binding protein
VLVKSGVVRVLVCSYYILSNSHITYTQIYTKHFLPHGITPKQFETIYNTAKILDYNKGSCIVRQGAKLDHVYLVVKGHTRANILGRRLSAVSTKPSPSDRMHGAAPGAWIGEMAFLEQYWVKEQLKMQPKAASSGEVQARKSSREDNKQQRKASQKAETETDVHLQSRRTFVLKEHPTPQLQNEYSLYSIAAKDDCTVLAWTHADMEKLLASSTDMRAAMTRAMSAAIVGKVINFTVSRSSQPTWSTWLDDWKASGAARIEVQEDESEATVDEKLPVYPIEK